MEVKDLFIKAKNRISDFQDNVLEFRLEQFEKNEENNCWSIVISYLIEKNENVGALLGIKLLNTERIYKEFKFKYDGEFIGFYIFEK